MSDQICLSSRASAGGARTRGGILRLTGGGPSQQSRQRLLELQRLQKALARVMDPESIGEWLETPNRAFDDLKPVEVVERGEVDRIWRMVFLLESGVPS